MNSQVTLLGLLGIFLVWCVWHAYRRESISIGWPAGIVVTISKKENPKAYQLLFVILISLALVSIGLMGVVLFGGEILK